MEYINEEYLTPKEYAEKHNIKYSSVMRYVREGKLESKTILGRYVIPKDAEIKKRNYIKK